MASQLQPYDFLAALALIALGSGVLGVLGTLMWRGARGSFAPWWEQKTINQKERVVALIEQLVQEGKTALIAPQLRSCLMLERIGTSARLVEQAHGVHLSLIGHMMDLAAKNSAHFSSLPVIEDLFVSRRDLQLSILDARASIAALISKRAGLGKEMPAWALTELKNRLNDFEDKLQTNSRSLLSKTRELEEEIQKMGEGSSVLYH